uniref:NADH dehydrogenase subunit 3 n=1 Tax=Eusudasina nantouensis TaxID=766123 RepID=UPI002E76AE67|nr:NADH dehydrogenase subunit 3 [Eusudasina nantouensis]WQB38484.1 NADH dehydrogenase subunit 3 [Eusudasina nantouensis]
MKIMATTLIMVTMINITLFITMMMSKKKKMNREKNSPFECGFSPMSSPRKPFSIQFFLMATIFLIFDIEISIILPMSTTKMINLEEWMISSTITMIILMLGLMLEWKMNMLEWTK